MSDTTQTPAKAKRETVADRQWIDLDGNETKDETRATGFRYVLLGPGAEKAERVANGKSFTYQFTSGSGKPETMLGIFGGLTKAGNIINTWNHLDPADRNPDPIEAVADWFKLLDSGQWGEERGGGIGARFDREHLATALAKATGRDRDEFVAKLADGAPKMRISRKPDGTVVLDPNGKQEVLYGTFALYNDKVRTAYNKLVGTKGSDLADL